MPGKLELCFDSNKLGEFILDKEVMIIGRKEDNDICIENLAVSGYHAKLLTIFEDSFLEDLSSTNGTYVNGKLIEKHPLKNGDVVTIGKHELRYLNDNKSDDDDIQKTVLIRKKPGPEAEITEPDLSKPLDMVDLSNAKLQILNGKAAGKELPLSKSSVKLGKSGAELVQINKRPDGHFIVCLDLPPDTLPPKINGEAMGSKAIKLQNHDVIEINRLKIEYYLKS